MNQLVIGLGEIGKPLLNVLGRSGAAVCGRDLEESDDIPSSISVLHICFPYSERFVDQVVDYVNEYAPRELIVIHTTVVPGTTREIERRTAHLWPIAYSPVRGRHGGMEDDLLRYFKFIAGATTEARERAGFTLEDVGFRVVQINPVEALELAKLLETTYSGLLISFAQEMDRYCFELDVNYQEMASFFAEVKWLPRYVFQPGVIGGHCIMQNLDLLERVMPSVFIDSIRQSNELKALEGGSTERLEPIPQWGES